MRYTGAGDAGPALRVPELAAPATASRRGAPLRTAAAASLVGLALDTDHGKDQDRPRLVARNLVSRRALPATGRKFNDGPHVRSRSIAARSEPVPQHAIIKISSWLTGCKHERPPVASRVPRPRPVAARQHLKWLQIVSVTS